MSQIIRLLLADDHRLVRESLSALLTKLAPEVEIWQADNFADGQRIIATESLDLAILDMVMPGMQGLLSIQSLVQQFPEVPIVILSGTNNPKTIIEAMQYGAAGFIPKTIRGSGLLNALKMILNGERYLPAVALPALASKQEPVVAKNHLPNHPQELTRREQQVLNLLATGRSNRRIAESLGVREVTIKAHLSNVFNKLGVSNRIEAVSLLLDHNRTSVANSGVP